MEERRGGKKILVKKRGKVMPACLTNQHNVFSFDLGI